MGGESDQVSGRVKETVGEVSDDSKFKAEDAIQQGIGKIKEAAADVGRKADDVLKKGKEEAGHLVDETREEIENPINDIRSKF